MSYTYLTKINPDANQYRYYSVRVDPDLFGFWTLFRQWGRLDADGGHLKMDSFDSEEAALTRLLEIVAQKKKRGYQ